MWALQIFPPPVTGGGGGTPGAPDKSIQYNNGGVFAGDANLLWDSATATMTITGNIVFGGTAKRVTADTSNATQSNRWFFQNSVVNGNTNLGLIPNGTSTTALLRAFGNSNPDAALAFTQVGQAGTVSIFDANVLAAGTQGTIELRIAAVAALAIDTSKNVQIKAGWQRPVVTKSGNYTISVTDDIIFADASGGSFTLTMPAANAAGANFSPGIRIKRIDSSVNTVTVARAGADTIDGATTYVLGALQAADLESDGSTKWGVM
jgi:hypothetical protein